MTNLDYHNSCYDLTCKEIPLSQGKVALVDNEDYKYLSQWKWFAHFNGQNWYAMRNNIKGHIPRMIRMHLVIIGEKPTGMDVDHINRNSLDNRRFNLRFATRSQNNHNGRLLRNNTSGCRGVVWHKYASKWMARIDIDNQQKYLGLFNSKSEAITARNNAEQYYGVKTPVYTK